MFHDKLNNIFLKIPVPALELTSGIKKSQKKENFYELTRRQRNGLLSIKIPTREDKFTNSVPLPERSYPNDGLPIWERLHLDKKLPMLKCPPNALVFARERIGKKVLKKTF